MDARDIVDSDPNWKIFPGELSALKRDEFELQLRELLDTCEAREVNGIVYVCAVQTRVPRLHGWSNIAYIGKTKGSFHDRYIKYVRTWVTGCCWHRAKTLIEEYGSYRIHYMQCIKPEEIETNLLRRYFCTHLEYPPENRQGPAFPTQCEYPALNSEP